LDAARVRGHIEADKANPARWRGQLQHVLPNPKKVRAPSHHAAMPIADLPAFFAKLPARPDVAPRALAFVIQTAARSGEALGMEWNEVDIDGATWTVPAGRMKAGKDHVVPLSDAAVAILRDQLKTRGKNAHVFPGARPTKPLSINALGAAMRRLGAGEFTVHGFRAAFRSWCADQGVAFEVAEACLAHAPGSEVVQAYQRSSMLERRRPVMAAWARHVTGESGKVVPFPKQA
jgi:integrase